MFEKYDLTGREPRPPQKDCLDWLEANWDKQDVFAIRAPTGAGKTFVARAIQVATNGCILTANNQLAAQYVSEYGINVVAGKDLFISKGQYDLSRDIALMRKHTVFNPISYYRLKETALKFCPTTVILDEADQFLGLYYEVISKRIKLEKGSEARSVPEALSFLRKAIKKIEDKKARCTIGSDKFLQCEAKIRSYTEILKAVAGSEGQYSVSTEIEGNSKYMKFLPVKFPVEWIKSIFKGAKVVMLSATLFDLDIQEMLGDVDVGFYEMPSPIPVERRAVRYRGIDGLHLTYPPNYDAIAEHLDGILDEFSERPAIIHTTYNEAEILQAKMNHKTMIHNKQDKSEVLSEWLEGGGVLLACGMQVGLDLKDDLCRLNIILKAQFPSQADIWVMKKIYGNADGHEWYENQELRMFIQACGGVREGLVITVLLWYATLGLLLFVIKGGRIFLNSLGSL